MNFQETKAHLATELAPQSIEHRVRFAFAGAIVAVGLFVTVVQCLNHELGWIGPTLAVIGAGVAFTKTVLSLVKALLPFKSSS